MLFVGVFVFMSLAGSILGLMISSLFEDSKPIVRWIIGIIVSCGFGALVTLGMWAEHTGDNMNIWNNGICSECGGDYNLVSVTHYRNSGDKYYWSCDDCGHVIETNKNMK